MAVTINQSKNIKIIWEMLLLVGNYHLRLLQSDSVSKTVYWVISTCMLYSTMLELQDDMDTSQPVKYVHSILGNWTQNNKYSDIQKKKVIIRYKCFSLLDFAV